MKSINRHRQQQLNKFNAGFTLLEVLVALAVFAILATLTASSMYYAFTTKTRIALQADQLAGLQLAIIRIERDTEQAISRSIIGNEMRAFPAFIGHANYVEFTRTGIVNPLSVEKRSTLQRVALICQDHQLKRRTWLYLDTLNRDQYDERVLLDNLTSCQFAYLNQTLQVLSEWRDNAVGQDGVEQLPKAVRLSISFANWDKFSQLFILTKALYAQPS